VAAILFARKQQSVKAIGSSMIVAALTLLAWTEPCRADAAQEAPHPEATLPRAQPEALQLGEQKAQWYDCSCYDQPVKHFPYSIVVFETATGDLVTRPERREGALTFSPLAHRYGTRYCTVDSEQDCYGSFPHPCDFTDFRYGPYLAEFFPKCMSDDTEPE
jgi:hypothetical protein